MPTPRRCTGCGAALGEPTDDNLTIVCRFCGLRHDINDLMAAGAPVVVTLARNAPRMSRFALGLIVAIIAVPLAGVLFVAYRAADAVDSRVRLQTALVQERQEHSRRPLALSELSTLTEFAWKTVDVQPPPGGFAAFEPVAALPWAMTIGQAWASDAVLVRINVGRVSSAGDVDVSGERTSGYRFWSPGRAARWKQETDAGSRSASKTSLMLEIRDETVRVIVDDSERDARPVPAPRSLPLPEILARAAQDATVRGASVLRRLPDPPAARAGQRRTRVPVLVS